MEREEKGRKGRIKRKGGAVAGHLPLPSGLNFSPSPAAFELWLLEKTLESPLDWKEIQPVNPKGNQPWIFTGRTDAEAEAPMLWPSDVKSWLIRKDPDAGKDWGQKKGVTDDEMVRWHHRFNEHEFEWTPGGSEDRESHVLQFMGSQRVGQDQATEQQPSCRSMLGAEGLWLSPSSPRNWPWLKGGAFPKITNLSCHYCGPLWTSLEPSQLCSSQQGCLRPCQRLSSTSSARFCLLHAFSQRASQESSCIELQLRVCVLRTRTCESREGKREEKVKEGRLKEGKRTPRRRHLSLWVVTCHRPREGSENVSRSVMSHSLQPYGP